MRFIDHEHLDKLTSREPRMRPAATLQSTTFVAGLFAGLIAIGVIAFPIAIVKCPSGPEAMVCLAIIASSSFSTLAIIAGVTAFLVYHVYYRWRTNLWLESYGVLNWSEKTRASHLREESKGTRAKSWTESVLGRRASRPADPAEDALLNTV
jgi:Zn-dependent protease with chaperone function